MIPPWFHPVPLVKEIAVATDTKSLHQFIVKSLSNAKTLAEADYFLDQDERLVSPATRWGLWDGWSCRPYSTAGLINQNTADYDKAESEYKQGRDLGRKLYLKRERESE